MGFKKLKNKILVHLKSFDITIDHILVHFVGSKQGLYVSFRIPLYLKYVIKKKTTNKKHIILTIPFLYFR